MTDLTTTLAAVAASSDRVLALDAALVARATQMAGDLAVNLSIALLIIAATWFGSKWAARTVRRALGRVKSLKDDRTVEGFVVQVVRVAVVVVGLVAVLQRLGVQTTSIIAVLGAASLAIGLAMQGALSNVAAGVVLLILRPYRVGDVVDIGGMAGLVQKLDLFTTQMSNANNVKIVVPNSQVLGGVIQNISGQITRRIEIDFTVSYSADLNEAREVIRSTTAGHGKVLENPPVWTGVTGLLDSAVQITLHAHVLSGDWWQTRADVFQTVKEALDGAGIEIPFPQAVEYFGGNVGKAAEPPPHKTPRRKEA
ncbi:MAG: mechanosensitive ion channel family protein [Brevundimonas sp.]|uniref:mechanosensitive ion channel family protein n=1 Tax=Brevundimonas sp. TaxID=1871086 RepID=UPI0039190728